MSCEHEWVYDFPPAVNARFCRKCGKTQKDHIKYERWINHTYGKMEFAATFGHEMPQVVSDRISEGSP